MQSREAACDEGEYAVKRRKALQAAASSVSYPTGSTQGPNQRFERKKYRCNIFKELQKLFDEDEESFSSGSGNESVQYKSLILEELVKRDRLNTIIINLYPQEKGYSIAFRTRDRTMCLKGDTEDMVETTPKPYGDWGLLRYLSSEELPPHLLDVLEQFQFLFYSGCVIAEVRDYRQISYSNICYTHHILLRPTYKTLLADINNLTKDRTDFSSDDKAALESELLLAHTPDLCLESDPHIENELAEVCNRKYIWNDSPCRKIAKKCPQATINTKRKLDQSIWDLDLFEYTRAKKRAKSEAQSVVHSSRAPLNKVTPEYKTVIPVPSLECPSIAPPTQPLVINQFWPIAWPEETQDCSLHLMEEYTLETDMPSKDKDNPRVYHIKLSIYRRPADLEYIGEMYLDRDHKKDSAGQNGVSCRFSLASRSNTNRYIEQFTEIFTEGGRKKILPRLQQGSARLGMHAVGRSTAQPYSREHMERIHQALLQGRLTGLNGVSPGLQQQLQMPHPVQVATVQKPQQLTAEGQEVNKFGNYVQIQAAANVKQLAAQQQQKLNALNNSAMRLPRKTTINNVAGGTRVLNHGNLSQSVPQTVTLTSVNNSRVNFLSEVQQPQTVTLSVESGGHINCALPIKQVVQNDALNAAGPSQLAQLVSSGTTKYTTIPVKQQVVNQRLLSVSSSSNGGNNSTLSAMLHGTPAADVPGIVSPNASPLFLEKLGGNSGQSIFAPATPKIPQQAQFVVQSPKGNAVISPMSSPPPQTSGILNLAQFQVIVSGSVPGGGGAPTGLLVSLPPGVATQTQSLATQGSQQVVQGDALSTAGPSQLAHLVSSGSTKNISQQSLRANSGSQTIQLAQGNTQFQLFSPLQRPNNCQTNLPNQANITSRALQRTPVTIKISPNTSQLTDMHFNLDK